MVDKLSNNLELKMCLFIVDLALCFSDTNVSYSRVYRHGNEVFTNMYPQIVPTEIYENVRRKTETNKYGTRSVEVVYLLRNNVICANGQEKLKCRIKPSNQCKIILAKKEVATGVTSRST